MKSNPCVRTCRKRDEKAEEKHLATNAIKAIERCVKLLHLNIENLKRKIEDI